MLIGAEIGIDNHLRRKAKLAAGEKRLPVKLRKPALSPT
jgi:hypothetical protein